MSRRNCITLDLTIRQCRDLDNGKSVRVVEPKSRREYVVLGAEEFDALKKSLAAETIDPSFFEFVELDEQ